MRKPLPLAHRYFTCTLLLILLTLEVSYAQNFSGHNWYFGFNLARKFF